MAKPSIYRVSQKRQGVIIDTTGPTKTQDGDVKQNRQAWQERGSSEQAGVTVSRGLRRVTPAEAFRTDCEATVDVDSDSL